jgi:hypothetical protein
MNVFYMPDTINDDCCYNYAGCIASEEFWLCFGEKGDRWIGEYVMRIEHLSPTATSASIADYKSHVPMMALS